MSRPRILPRVVAELSARGLVELPGYPGYFADPDGNIFGRFGRPLVPSTGTNGYLHVAVGFNRKKTIHSLMATAFHGPGAPGMVVRHLNGNSLDNRACNLAWGTQTDNAQDAIRHGTAPYGERHGSARLSAHDVALIRERHRSGAHADAIAKEFNTSVSNVRHICSWRSWRRERAA